MKKYIIWIEGLEPKTGQKVKRFYYDRYGIPRIEYTCKMMKALRVSELDLSRVRNILERAGISGWVLGGRVFIKTSYCPKGTLFQTIDRS